MQNDELCRSLSRYDIFVSINHFGGISKAVLEASLTGLPIVANRHREAEGNELFGDYSLLVEDTDEGYYGGISRLLGDGELRKKLGTAAVEKTGALRPEKMEKRLAELYEEYMKR